MTNAVRRGIHKLGQAKLWIIPRLLSLSDCIVAEPASRQSAPDLPCFADVNCSVLPPYPRLNRRASEDISGMAPAPAELETSKHGGEQVQTKSTVLDSEKRADKLSDSALSNCIRFPALSMHDIYLQWTIAKLWRPLRLFSLLLQ